MPKDKYNINELLEKKKSLELQIADKISVGPDEVKFYEEKFIDFTNANNNRTNTPRAKQTLDEFSASFSSMVDELARVKTAIQKYNASEVLGKIQLRESVRFKIARLNNIKKALVRDSQSTRTVTRASKDNETLEVKEVKIEPMFKREDIDKQLNELAAQERRTNTEIQKINLNAAVDLE